MNEQVLTIAKPKLLKTIKNGELAFLGHVMVFVRQNSGVNFQPLLLNLQDNVLLSITICLGIFVSIVKSI